MKTIRSVAVLGAGTMGTQIAALIANSGVPVRLLDITRDDAFQGITRARCLKPDPAFTPETWRFISPGSFDVDLARAGACDWVIEAIVEKRDAKQSLLTRVDAVRQPDTLVTSNTSALSVTDLANGRSDGFRRNWCGTHFFNPPRYLPLLELVPTPDTERVALDRLSRFCDQRLGKSVVVARDRPGFIANRIGLYSAARILREIALGRATVEEVDAITGPAIGRPKSATCRTLDLAGLDIVSRVMADLRQRLPDSHEQNTLILPPFVQRLIAAGAFGEKTGHGMYRRGRAADGSALIEVVDPTTLEYRATCTPRLLSLESVRTVSDVRARLRALFSANDGVGAFLRTTLGPTLVYAAAVAPEIAESIDDVDRVMRWGFGWELGPFEIIDALGVREVLAAAREADPVLMIEGPPRLLRTLIKSTPMRLRSGPLPPAGADLLILQSARARSAVVATSEGASLVDLGDGVLTVEFHSKMNTLGAGAIQMIERGISEAAERFVALVIGNEGPHFSTGADLALVLTAAQQKDWDAIDRMVRALQTATMRLRYADVPVVVGAAGLTLGGGVELILHAHRVQAAAETYLGLVETGVGLIPAGGGTKEMLARAVERASGANPMQCVQRAFETIAFGTVSTSAADGYRLGLLPEMASISMNRERLMSDAKRAALAAAADGYRAPAPRSAIPVGGDCTYAPLALGVHLAWRAGRISDHDAKIGRALATVMAGGRLPHATTVTEQHLLDLEREAFLSLVAEPLTQDRIAHTLTTGTPLRN